MKTARVETDKFYRGMIMFFESRLLAGDLNPAFNAFITELNAVVKRFKDLLAQEFGRRIRELKIKN